MPREKKIKKLAELEMIIRHKKKNGKKVVFTNGCFDILHRGHVKLLEKAKSLGDILVVALNSDSSVRKIKGPRRPVNQERDRAYVLSAIESVDYITIFREPSPRRVIKRLRPDMLVKGGDWSGKDIVGADFVRSGGGRVCTVPLAKGFSTSLLIGKIAKIADG